MCGVSTLTSDNNKMKAKSLIICLLALLANSIAYAAKTPSQRTYTLFPDGHYERKTCYTDGSCDNLEQGMFHKPIAGKDLNHVEEVWRNGKWVVTVSQSY